MKETTFDNVKLIHGDCMDFMRTLPDNAFDLAVVDPPYGDGGSELKGAICGRFCGKFENFMGYTLPTENKTWNRLKGGRRERYYNPQNYPPPPKDTGRFQGGTWA